MHQYYIEWKSVAASGTIEGNYSQTIHAHYLVEAMNVWEKQHSSLSPDEHGVCLVITCVSWQPEGA